MKPGEPSITRRAVHDSGDDNLPIRRVVIHVTCPGVGYPAASKKGTASGTAKYFQMQSSGGSAHYIHDSSRDEQHCVPEDTIAWHAPPNPHTIGIEICGEATYTRAQWLSAAVWPAVEEAAARTRELCTRYDLPMRKLSVAQVKANDEGVCGHVDVSMAFRQTDHSDPGPGFPWDEFMHLVNADAELIKPTPEEDDVPEIVSLGARADQKVPANGALVVDWRQEWTDTGSDHADQSPHFKVEVGYWAICDGLIKLRGFKPGEQVDIAWSRFKADGKTLKDDAWAVTYTADLYGRVEASIGGQFQLDSSVLGCLRILNSRPYEVVLEKVSMAKLALFKR